MDDRAAAGERFALGVACASLALSNVTAWVYAATGQEMPIAAAVLFPICTSISIVAWFWNYSVRRGIGWPLDMGYFLLVAWFAIIPFYLIRREGRVGLSKAALFAFVYFASWAVGAALFVWARVL